MRKKNALVTVGGNGIGRVTALTFAREGAKVVVADLNREAANAVVAQIAQHGGHARCEQVDVTEAAQVERMIQNTLNTWGRLDILVNNADILSDARLVKMSLAQWQRVLDVNLKNVFLCAQAAARVMETQNTGGVISNAASVVGLYGNFGQSNYVAAKAGVIGMTKTWARELGKKGIRGNAVAPGFIATQMVQAMPEKVLTMMKEKTPLGRLGARRNCACLFVSCFRRSELHHRRGALGGRRAGGVR